MGAALPKLKIDGGDFERNTEDCLDLNALLHPAQAFSHPADVVSDPDLTLNEKRAILASWASDACAVESVPELRRAPVEGGRPVAFDDVMDALRALDACQTETSSRYHRVVRKRRIFSRGSGESGRSQPLQ
jgi:hypothetical protein